MFKKYLPPFLIGCLLTTLFLWKNITWPAVNTYPPVGTDDITDYQYPFRVFMTESLKKGEFPLWSADMSGGFPLFAESQLGAAYPVNLISAYFLSAIQSLNASLFCSYLLLFLAAYFYFSEIKLGKSSAIFGAVSVTFGGFAANELLHFPMNVSFGYFLVQITLAEKLINNRSMPFSRQMILAIVMGITLGLSTLGGHSQIIFYSLLYLFIYWGYGWWKNSLQFPISSLQKKSYSRITNHQLSITNNQSNSNFKIPLKHSLFKWLLLIFVFLIVGASVGAVQALPEAEFTLNSPRKSGVSPGAIEQFNYPLTALADFIFPFSSFRQDHSYEAYLNNGWPWDERYVYPGILAFGLMMYGLWLTWKRKAERYYYHGRIFTFTLLISVFLAFGTQLMFGYILTVPPFSFFRIPFRTIFLADFAIAGLAAIGLDSLLSGLNHQPLLRRLSSAQRPVPSAYRWLSSANLLVSFTLIVILFADLKYHNEKLHPLVKAADWYRLPETVQYLKDHLQPQERVFNQQYFYPAVKLFLSKPDVYDGKDGLINLRNLLPVFNNLIYAIPKPSEAVNSAALKVDRYNWIDYQLFFQGLPYINDETISSTDSFNFLCRLLGVHYVITAAPLKSDMLSQVKSLDFADGQDPVRIYEYSDYYPRTIMVPSAQKAKPEEIQQHLLKGDFYIDKLIYIEEDSDWGAKGGFSATSQIKNYQDQRVEIESQSAGDSWLFLSDPYYPGWKAYVDGQETKIYLADYAFRAVQVPEGKHEIVFSYEPESFKWGLRITVVGILTAVGGIVLLMIMNNLTVKSKIKYQKSKSQIKI